MKKLLALVVFLLGFIQAIELCAVPDSCLALYCPDDGVSYNPDHILIDTCKDSPTYGDWFQSGTWTIGFKKFIFRDSIKSGKKAYFNDIDSINFPNVFAAFKTIIEKFGKFAFVRYYYSCVRYSENDYYNEPCLDIFFETQNRTKDVEFYLNQIPGITFVRMTNYPVKSDISASCLCLLWRHDPENGYINACGIKKDTCKDSTTFSDWYLSHTLIMSMKEYIFSKLIPRATSAFVEDIDTTKYFNIRDSILLLEKKFGRMEFFRDPYECFDESDKYFVLNPCLDISFPKYNRMKDVLADLNKLSISNYTWLKQSCYPYNDITENFSKLMELKPNPCYDKLTIKNIEAKEISNQQIEIYNYLGSKLVALDISNRNNDLEIDVSSLEEGIYFIRINNKIFKFIKLR